MITITFLIKGFIPGDSAIQFIIVATIFGLGMICYTLTITTLFSDSKLSTQIGGLALILPIAVFMALYRNNLPLVQLFYWIPHFPMTAILTHYVDAFSVADLNMGFAWVALILNIPLHFALYMYLDQVVPNTYGISKSCCFCLRRKRQSNASVYSSLI